MAEEAAVVAAVVISVEDVAAEVVVMEEEAVAGARAMHFRKANAREAVAADSLMREEAAAVEVRTSGPNGETFPIDKFR